MRGMTRFTCGWVFFSTVAVLASLRLAFPTRVNAQSQGNDAVYNSNASCSSTTSCGFSGAFIDASTFANSPPPTNRNFCGVSNYVLVHVVLPNYPNGAVIDARGLNSTNTSMQCKDSPWAGITTPVPSTILLPAGTILIPKSWILPANTHLIGESDNPSSATSIAGTTIQACNSQKNTCRVAHLLQLVGINRVWGAPFFRVLCERAGAGSVANSPSTR
jgi:hypothetical protein